MAKMPLAEHDNVVKDIPAGSNGRRWRRNT
jgi:hypothetical protein